MTTDNLCDLVSNKGKLVPLQLEGEGGGGGGQMGRVKQVEGDCLPSHRMPWKGWFTTLLALFPGSCAWAEKKRAWYTLFAHAQFPQDFWEFWKFP